MFFCIFRIFNIFPKSFGQYFSWAVHRTQYQEKSWPKTFRKNAKKAKNAKKKPYFYNVKRENHTCRCGKKCEKLSRIHLFPFFAFFRICMCGFSPFYIIKATFFCIFSFFALFLKVFGQDFSWAVHRTQYTTVRSTFVPIFRFFSHLHV